MPKKPPRVFLDTSVILAGCASSTGASRIILDACFKGKVVPVVSRVILQECERNFLKKFSKKELLFFYRWLGKAPLVLEKLPAEEEIKKFYSLIATKDVHVLATAVQAKTEFLVTLDKKHFFTPKLKKAKLPLKILTPGELVGAILKSK